jgi:hypothetical protein
MPDPSILSQDYRDLETTLRLPYALIGGTDAMRAEGERFLPREERESVKDYESRLNRTFLFGGYERTVSILTGEIHDKSISLQKETPEQIKNLSFNIDNQGRNLTRFSKDFTEQAIINGTGWILVDAPPLPRDNEGNEIKTTVDDDKRLNRRPYWVNVTALNFLGCKIQDGELIQVRIKEIVQEDDGEFATEDIEQIRVLYPGRWEVYREQEREWYLFDQGTSPLNKIAIVPLFTGRKKSDFTAKPPLTGLAELNQQHWISSSDQNNILHIARVPILFGKRLQTDDNGKVIVSIHNLIHSQDDGADLRYVEHSGQAMSDGWKDLAMIKEAMALWGLELISSDRSGDITATERAMTGAKTGSFLNAVALDLQDVLNSAIELTCEILGVDYTGGATVNTDFSLALNNFDTNTLLNAFKNGLLDRATTIDEMKRRGVISENADPVEIAAAIQNESSLTGGFSALGNQRLVGTNPK